MNRHTLFLSYAIEFTVCAFCGWLYEEGLELLVNHAYADRGVLHLPLLPIYGFGGLLLVCLFRKHKHPAFVFVVSALAATVLELYASYLLERTIGYVPWYYGAWWLNYQGRISLPSSLIFGGLALLLVNVVHPLCRRLCRDGNETAVCAAGALCMGAMVCDFLLTFVF